MKVFRFILGKLILAIAMLSLLPLASRAQEAAALSALKLEQVEQLLTIGWDDAALARELLKRGIAFRPDAKALERLTRKKLGAQTRAALAQLDIGVAFNEIQNTKDPNARLNLSQQFLRQYPQSQFVAQVNALLGATELEAFDTAYQAYLAAPELTKLNALFTRSDEWRQHQPDAAMADAATAQAVTTNAALALQLTTRLALATGRGVLDNFYTDLERSRQLALAAFQQLDATTAPANLSAEMFQRLRHENLGALCQLLALYQLRQTPADTSAALRWLARAAAPDAPTAQDPVTYWLRATANREQAQKLRLEHAALPFDARTGSAGQSICQQLAALTNHLIEDYTKVVELSGAASLTNSRSLRDEAVAAVKALSQTPSPCVLPAMPPAQRARRVGGAASHTLFIRSKTVYLKPPQLETILLKDPDFQALGWRIVRNEKEADVIAEIALPFLTWQWTVELINPATSQLLGSVQVRETVARNAIPKIAPQLIELLKQAKF